MLMSLLRLLLIPVLALAAAPAAQAHAFLDHADPRVGSTVSVSPTRVQIWFTEELEPAFSKIKVFDPHQVEIDAKDVKLDATKKNLLTVSVPKLAPGTYEVRWNVVATDTHPTHGTFSFRVAGD